MRYLLLLFLVGCSGALHIENDILTGLHSNSDSAYTHGTKFSYFPESNSRNEHISYSLGQTIFTPEHKKADATPASLKIDRPYAGGLFLERQKVEYTSEDIRDTWGVALGCVGECSLARKTQREFHRQLDQYPPTWNRNYYLSKNEPGIIINAERAYLVTQTENFDIATYGGIKAGSLINSAALGADIRVGFNRDRFSPEAVTFKLPREASPRWVGYVFGKLEGRAVAWNYFLDGSLFSEDSHNVTSKWNVGQADIGFVVGYNNFRFVYRLTFFSAEWKEKSDPVSFGGVTVQW